MKKVKKISIVSFSVVFLVAFIMAICIILLQYNNAIVAQAEMQIYQDSHRYDSELKNLTHLQNATKKEVSASYFAVVYDCGGAHYFGAVNDGGVLPVILLS